LNNITIPRYCQPVKANSSTADAYIPFFQSALPAVLHGTDIANFVDPTVTSSEEPRSKLRGMRKRRDSMEWSDHQNMLGNWKQGGIS
jgi:hypothetical protein